MTKQQAIRHYFKNSMQPRKTIDKLMQWDKTKTLSENANLLKISPAYACRFYKLYNLRVIRASRQIDVKKVMRLRKIGMTYEQIGRLYRVSRQRIEQVIKGL